MIALSQPVDNPHFSVVHAHNPVMGIRYYGWPLRTELDVEAALQDPCAVARAIDAREGDEGGDNCLGLDKSFRLLLSYFLGGAVSPDHTRFTPANEIGDRDLADLMTRCECVDDRQIMVLPRPGALILQGDVLFEPDGLSWKPFYGVIHPSYVQAVADDFAMVDLDEFQAAFADPHTDGSYCREQFEPFREAIMRFADDGLGYLYMIA